ncbi:MAG: FlgB family protein [Rhodobacteraceae bacterium]|nr:FlgB family protein [Paracoccaceae bacterium]
MTYELSILSQAQALIRHASQRQTLVAANIANADTPGYRSRDLRPFSDTYDASAPPDALRRTRPGHFNAPRDMGAAGAIETGDAAKPNGNNVSLESEMIRGAHLRGQYDMALGIYRTSLSILRTSLGRR